MTNSLNWQEILTILIPILALMGWVYNRIEKKADERQKEMKEEFKEVKQDIKSLEQDIKSLESRVSRIEGHLTGMGHHWEPMIREKKEE